MYSSSHGVSPFHYNKDYNCTTFVTQALNGVSPFHYNKDYNNIIS